LPDGSYLSLISPDDRAHRQKIDGIPVRVIEYSLPRPSRESTGYRLMITLLSAEAAPAAESAGC